MPKIAVITAEANHNLDALLEARADKNLKDGDLSVIVSHSEDMRSASGRRKQEWKPYP
jgi:hypothetical protein